MELGLVLVILFAGTDESPSDSSLSLSRSVKCCCRFNSIIVALIVTDFSNLPSSIPNGKYALHCNNTGAWNDSVPRCLIGSVSFDVYLRSNVKLPLLNKSPDIVNTEVY